MGWYNENENRSYPVYENATGLSTAGVPLAYAVLADLALSVPRSLSDGLYFSSVVVTPALVAVALARNGAAIAAGTWAQPVVPHVPYALVPMADMVSGHIVFGSGIQSGTVSFLSVSAEASGLDDRAVHPVEGPVVLSVGRYFSQDSAKLGGVVKLVQGDNITIRFDGGRLKIGLADMARSAFVGPCDKQALFNNCGYPPIRTINGVGPDEDGAVTIEVDNTI